jgi:hypothetical protein
MPREPLVLGQPRSPISSRTLDLERDAAHVVPLNAGIRIEIDAQFVGVIEIARAHRMRMQLDAAEIDDPREPGGVVDTTSSAVRPDGNESVTVRSHGGRWAGARF